MRLSPLVLLMGCLHPESPRPAPRTAYSIDELPAVDFNLPDLDGGRMSIPTPAGWHSGTKRADLVVWFYHKDRNGLPRILISASDVSSGIADTLSDTIDIFVEAIQAELESEKDLIEPAKALRLGDRFWVRYVMLGRTKEGMSVERQFLRTVQNGRDYSLELQIPSGTIHQFKTTAYAIAAHMKPAPSDATLSTPTGNDRSIEPVPAKQ